MGHFKKDKYIFSNMSLVSDKGRETASLREKEISLLIKELFLYKVLLRDLVNQFPTYKDRNLILNIAYYMIEEEDIFNSFERMRALPIVKLARETNISKGFLEVWQEYIIAYAIILSNPNYYYIQDYLKIEERQKDVVNISNSINKDEISYRGVVLKVNKKSVIVLTSSGEFMKIKKSDGVEVGQETHGFEKKGLARYKFHIALGLTFIFLICFAAYRSYNKIDSTVVFTATSQVKMHINNKNKVIYSYSASDKGNDMINAVNPMDRNIDDCLKEFMEYAKDNEMVPQDGFIIIITGKALKYDELEKTDEYIVDNNISVQINNGGSLHNVYESVQIKRKEAEGK